MSDWAQVLIVVVTCLTSVITAYLAWQVERSRRTIEVIHRATNSMTERLIRLTDVESHARGLAEGRAESVQGDPPRK